MEKANIDKYGFGWQLKFENGKSMTINWPNIPNDWDHAPIFVVRRDKSGQPVELKKGETILSKAIQTQQIPTPPPNNNNNNNNNNNRPNNRSAKSPYNFIPLNDTVVYPEEQRASFDKYDPERKTGYINLKIKNLTDLIISKGADSNRTHDFLRIGENNKPIIPGSSLRGLIKKMVGILSYSRLMEGGHYDNHALFYRGIADKAFTAIYQPAFFDLSHNNDYKPLAGYLNKKGNEYIIYPAIKNPVNAQYFKIRGARNPTGVDPTTKRAIFIFDGKRFVGYNSSKTIYFEPKPKALHYHDSSKRYLNYALVTNFSFTLKQPTWEEGTLVITGGMGRKKHDQWIVNLQDNGATPLKIPAQVIRDYKNDSQRDEEFDLLEKQRTQTNVPCFYLTDQHGNVASFGHTPLYRLKHAKTIKDAIQQGGVNDKLDFEQLIFGDTEHFASRVYFEDAIIENYQNTQAERTLIKILSSPKPTSHQLYLKQDNMPLKTWSSNSIEISGTKEYWHKNVTAQYWEDSGVTMTKSHAGYIKPIKPNNIFNGRIRFENLTDKELGALLYALELPQDCCHKIGMGKPLGLGSIRITPELTLDDRKDRYTKLLDDKGSWYLPQGQALNDFKKSFSDYILLLVGNKKTDLWEVERLSQLRAMLTYDEKLCASTDWLNETRYMEIEKELDENGVPHHDDYGNPKPKNEFKDRAILDTPKNILSKFKKH